MLVWLFTLGEAIEGNKKCRTISFVRSVEVLTSPCFEIN